jgi:hypothetical protein
VELQHDTSSHEVELAGRRRTVQTASAVLHYSRMLFFQCYPTFQHFDCKVFLTDALRYMGGAPARWAVGKGGRAFGQLPFWFGSGLTVGAHHGGDSGRRFLRASGSGRTFLIPWKPWTCPK